VLSEEARGGDVLGPSTLERRLSLCGELPLAGLPNGADTRLSELGTFLMLVAISSVGYFIGASMNGT